MSEIDVNALKDEELVDANGGAVKGTYYRYKIKKGDTLIKIAARFGTTVDILCEINNIVDKSLIIAGHYLFIPTK